MWPRTLFIFQVHRIVAEWKAHHVCPETQKKSLFEQHRNSPVYIENILCCTSWYVSCARLKIVCTCKSTVSLCEPGDLDLDLWRYGQIKVWKWKPFKRNLCTKFEHVVTVHRLDVRNAVLMGLLEPMGWEPHSSVVMVLLGLRVIVVSRFTRLIRQSDGEHYNKNQFNDLFLANFKFFVVTKNPFPATRLVEMTYPITVCMPNAGF